MSVDMMNIGELEKLVGGLSKPSKMPSYGYSIPAAECGTGSKLRLVENSVCSGCYALKGRYVFPNVAAALYRRLAAIEKPEWAAAMATLIRRKRRNGKPLTHFRWHDAGDLQSLSHLEAIVEVCKQTPEVKHWLPTREYRIVTDYVSLHGELPVNLNIRLSALMIGGFVPKFPRLAGIRGITISTVGVEDAAYHCPAPTQGNSCGDCRACWNPEVPSVDYHLH